jgi:hypothetical protein
MPDHDHWDGISDEACLQLEFDQMQTLDQTQTQRGAGGAPSAPPPPPPPSPATTRRGSSTGDPPAVTSHSIVAPSTAAPSVAMPSATLQIGPWARVRVPFAIANNPRRLVLVVEPPTPKAQGVRQSALVLTPSIGKPIASVATLLTLDAVHKDNLITCAQIER